MHHRRVVSLFLSLGLFAMAPMRAQVDDPTFVPESPQERYAQPVDPTRVAEPDLDELDMHVPNTPAPTAGDRARSGTGRQQGALGAPFTTGLGTAGPAPAASTLSTAISWDEAGQLQVNASGLSLENTPLESRLWLDNALEKNRQLALDLPTALALVEVRNPVVGGSVAQAKLARTYYYQALTTFLPDVIATYDQSKFEGAIQIFGSETIQVTQNRVVPQLEARVTYVPGTLFTASAANRQKRAAEAQASDTLQDQWTATAVDFYTWVEAYEQLLNNLRSQRDAESSVNLSQQRFTVGTGTKLDVLRAQNRVNQQKRAVIESENTVARAEQRLLARLNLDPSIRLMPASYQYENVQLVNPSADVNELLALTLATHPVLVRVSNEVEGLEREVWSALAGFLPSVTLRAYVNGVGPSLDQLSRGTFGGFALQMNLLEKMGTAYALRIQERKRTLEAKRAEAEALRRDLETQVVSAWLDARAFRDTLDVAQGEVETASEALRLANGRYSAGLGIQQDVLEAERDYLTARLTLVQNLLGHRRAQLALIRAMGQASPEHLLVGLSQQEITEQLAAHHHPLVVVADDGKADDDQQGDPLDIQPLAPVTLNEPAVKNPVTTEREPRP